MAVEAIQKVTQVEAEADRRKEEAMAEKVLEQAKLDCEQWKRTARTRLDQAARAIVEKVVNR